MFIENSQNALRRGGRVAEGARLESVYAGNRIEGSNPSPSAIFSIVVQQIQCVVIFGYFHVTTVVTN